jgi:hypothetical protein
MPEIWKARIFNDRNKENVSLGCMECVTVIMTSNAYVKERKKRLAIS